MEICDASVYRRRRLRLLVNLSIAVFTLLISWQEVSIITYYIVFVRITDNILNFIDKLYSLSLAETLSNAKCSQHICLLYGIQGGT